MLDTNREPDLLRQKAAEALKKAGDYDKAAKLLEQWARKDPVLLAAITGPALPQLCRQAVRDHGRDFRATLSRPVRYGPIGGNGERMFVAYAALLKFPLCNGGPLGEAYAGDIIESANHYRAQGQTMINDARWLMAVVEKIGNQQVKDVFDDQSLAKLREATKS